MYSICTTISEQSCEFTLGDSWQANKLQYIPNFADVWGYAGFINTGMLTHFMLLCLTRLNSHIPPPFISKSFLELLGKDDQNQRVNMVAFIHSDCKEPSPRCCFAWKTGLVGERTDGFAFFVFMYFYLNCDLPYAREWGGGKGKEKT